MAFSKSELLILSISKTFTNKAVLGSAGAIVGRSAYEVALANGFVGSETQWLQSLNGRSVEMRNDGAFLQWRLVGDTSWINIVDVATLKGDKGDDGREIELRISGTELEWRHEGDATWTSLFDFAGMELPATIHDYVVGVQYNVGDVFTDPTTWLIYRANRIYTSVSIEDDLENGDIALIGGAVTIEMLDAKLDKATGVGTDAVYGVTADDEQVMFKLVSNAANAGTIPKRNDNGNFAVSTPEVDEEVANKKYVDDKISETAQQIVYINDISGVVTNGTSSTFINSLLDKGFGRGHRLIGMVSFTDFPIGMFNAELTLDVFSMSVGNILYIAQLASTDTSPYVWFAVEQTAGAMRWRPIGDGIDPSTIDLAEFLNESSDPFVRKSVVDDGLSARERVLTAGTNVVIDRTNPDSPIVSVSGVDMPTRFISTESVAEGVGATVEDLDLTEVTPIVSGNTLAVSDIVIFANGTQGEVIAVDTGEETYNIVVVAVQQAAAWGTIGGVLSEQADLQGALDGKVSDVTLDGTTVVADGVANLITPNADIISFESQLDTPIESTDPMPLVSDNVEAALDELTERNQAVQNRLNNTVKFYVYTDITMGLMLKITYTKDIEPFLEIAPRLAEVVIYMLSITGSGTSPLPDGDPANLQAIASAFVAADVIGLDVKIDYAGFLGAHINFENIAVIYDNVSLTGNEVVGTFSRPTLGDEEIPSVQYMARIYTDTTDVLLEAEFVNDIYAANLISDDTGNTLTIGADDRLFVPKGANQTSEVSVTSEATESVLERATSQAEINEQNASAILENIEEIGNLVDAIDEKQTQIDTLNTNLNGVRENLDNTNEALWGDPDDPNDEGELQRIKDSIDEAVTSDGSVEQHLSMSYADYSQLALLEPNTVYNVEGHPADEESSGGGGALKLWSKTVTDGTSTFTAEVQHTGDTGALEVLTDDILIALVFVAAVLQETTIGSTTNIPIQDFQTLVKGLYDAKVARIHLSGTDGVSILSANMENWQVLYDETRLDYNEMFAVMSMPMAGRNLQSNKFELRIYYDDDSGEVLVDAVFGGGYFMQKLYGSGTISLNPSDTAELFSNVYFGDYFGISGMEFEIDELNGIVKFPKIASYTPYTIETRITANVQGEEADYTIAIVRPSGERLAKDTESVKLGTSGGFENNSNTLQTYTDGANDPYSTDGVRLLLTNYELGEPLEITGIEIRIQGVRS